MILLKQLLMESVTKRLLTEQTTTTYEFRDSFPDNIVLPINPKQLNITSFDKITSINQLTPNLQNFINTLKSAILSKKLTKGNITITASADGNAAATKQVPGGDGVNWNQAQVDFSYSNGASLSNQTLADRRAQGIEYVIKRFVKLPAEVTITKTGNGAGTKKLVTVVVPIVTYNLQTPKTNITNPKTKKIEIFDLAAAKYTLPAYTDVKIPIAKCNGSLQANGVAGNPIAYRSKLETKSGTVSMNFTPAYIPDRLVITQYDTTKKTTKIIHDTGYVSDSAAAAQVDFGTVLADLNNKNKSIGYNGIIKQPTTVTVDLGQVPNTEYFVEIYAPLGPTVWMLTINCQVANNSETSTPAPMPSFDAFVNSNSFNGKLYWDKSYSSLVKDTDSARSNDLGWAGQLKNGKFFDGQYFAYDKDGILQTIDMYGNGKFIGKGQL